MSTFFAIAFLAALVGCIKPYIKNFNRMHFAIVAFTCFLISAITHTPISEEKQDQAGAIASEAPPATAVASTEKSSPAATPTAAPTSKKDKTSQPKWHYSETKDEMRGTSSRFATVDSNNKVDMGFPYGRVYGQIIVRERPSDGLNIMFAINKGQILCHSFSDEDYVTVKFDDNAIERYSCSSPSDGSSETAFLSNEKLFLSNLKKSRKLIVEAEFFQNGRQQFTFDIAGLKWE